MMGTIIKCSCCGKEINLGPEDKYPQKKFDDVCCVDCNKIYYLLPEAYHTFFYKVDQLKDTKRAWIKEKMFVEHNWDELKKWCPSLNDKDALKNLPGYVPEKEEIVAPKAEVTPNSNPIDKLKSDVELVSADTSEGTGIEELE